MDDLVELHVLARSGDTDTAAAAADGVRPIPPARHAWDAVDRACELVREHPHSATEHP